MQFLQGAPLVMIPAMFAFPAWVLLVERPRFQHAHIIAIVVFALFAGMLGVGVRKLVRCVRWRELDIIGAMAFGVLLVLFVMVLYAFVFFLALHRGDMGSL